MSKTKAYILSDKSDKYNLPSGKRQEIRCIVWDDVGRVLAITDSPIAAVEVKKKDVAVRGGRLEELLIDRDNEYKEIQQFMLDACLKDAPDDKHSKGALTKYIKSEKGLGSYESKRYAEVIRKIRLFEVTEEQEKKDPLRVGEDSYDDLILHEKMFEYQREAVATMVKNEQNILLNDPMGAGKSIQSIFTMVNIDKWPILVVCPSSVKTNWKHEIMKWIPNSKEEIDIVNGQTGPYQINQWTIVNWAILHHRKKGLAEFDWGGIIADEIHYAKNGDAKRSQAMVEISQANSDSKVLGLSGTPVMNRPSEIHNQLKVLRHPLGGMNFYNFCRRFCGGYNAPYGFETDYLPNARLNDLSEAISDTLIKRDRRDILDDLPPLRRGWYHVDVMDESVDQFTDELSEFKGEYNRMKREADTEHIIAKIQNLRMLSAYGKSPAVGQIAKENVCESNQVLLFCDFKDPLDIVEEQLEKEDFGIERITGDTTDNKYEISERFNDRDNSTRMILATSAAETGINLTGADEVWFLSLSWNPMSHRQREDRALRIGREHPVLARYFESNLEIDTVIADMLQEKLEAVREVIGTAEEDHFTEEREERESVMEIADKIVY